MKSGILLQVILEASSVVFTFSGIFVGLGFISSLQQNRWESFGMARYGVLLLPAILIGIGLLINTWGRKRKSERRKVAKEAKQELLNRP